ncbi:MAG: HYR domain-containing protein, partial [Saprospiraceae bacterium]
IERTWIATDSAGMVGSCVQDIYFRRQSMSMVVFPPNRDGIEGPIVTCTDGGTDPANVGSPTIGGDAIYPNLVGFCQLDAGFRDETISFCAGNLQIVRTWTVVDACTGNHTTDIQIISVVDTTGPALLCPDTILASVDNGACNATVTFPYAVAKDECSTASVRIETPFGNIEDNGGELSWIPVGYHEVTYIAIDECNNRTSCTTILHVADRTAPVAACDFINDVSLRATGIVVVDASVFDDGSRDACSGNQVTFQVQRVNDTLGFADFVTFYCTDAGDTLYVNLEVTDINGNSDVCVAAIAITNDTPPQITCPADVTINCTDDYTDLVIFGVPTILDDCGGTMNYTERDSFEINTCGSGRIIRTFEVNHGGSTISCSQVITLSNNSTFDGNTIRWPTDYLTFACANQPLSPDALPDGFNVPTYDSIGNLCSRILLDYEDDEFDDGINPVGCYTILRTWSIIDWCTFNPNDTTAGGYWSHVQQIDLVNVVAPTFTNCPNNLTVDIVNNTCQAMVSLAMTAADDCTPVNELIYAYTIDLNDDGSVDFTGMTNDATAAYPVGTHRARFTVADDCGNSTACNFLFTVRDGSAPIASCMDGTFNIQDIGDELAALVDLRQLAINSTDNCANFDDLVITANLTSFGCNQLGDNQVTLTIADEAGNTTDCTVNITITDTNSLCQVSRTEVSISGIIVNEMGERVDQVAVSINHPDVETSMTDETGEFKLKDVPIGNDYTILPTRDFDILNGVSTFDLVLISRHILNIEAITSPYRLIAADVNRSKTITAYDIVQLRRLILRLSSDFSNNTSWRFVRTDFAFDNAKDPNQAHFPEVYNINNLPKNDMKIEGFVAVKIGDVNGSARTHASFSEGESRNATNTLKLHTENQFLEAGTLIEVPFYAPNFNQLLGCQFAIDFETDYLDLLEIMPNKEASLSANNFGESLLNRGLVTVSWNQPTSVATPVNKEAIFTLKFKVKETTNLSRALSINTAFMKAEAYMTTDNASLELLDVALLFKSPLANQDFELYQNKPNPFNQHTMIGFELPQSEIVTLNIIDITGKLVRQVEQQALAGYNELKIDRKDMEEKGVYYYQLATSTGIATKKMIIVE